jgi:myo-inositol-1(or 4)-monophosphatase
LHAWDLAAGLLLVREAGGMTDAIGTGSPLDTGAAIAGNASLFKEFRGLVQGA